MLETILGSWLYLIWLVFYFILIGFLTLGFSAPFYLLFFALALLPKSERIWRWVTGIRPLRIRAEKERLIPLLEEVRNSCHVKKKRKRQIQNINIYIQESMSINAFAFGRETLVLTKGSVDLLSDDALKGLIAHELGHFYNYDAMTTLFVYIANFPLIWLMKQLRKIDDILGSGLGRLLFSIIFAFFRFIEFLGDLILMHRSRAQEYKADALALKWGICLASNNGSYQRSSKFLSNSAIPNVLKKSTKRAALKSISGSRYSKIFCFINSKVSWAISI